MLGELPYGAVRKEFQMALRQLQRDADPVMNDMIPLLMLKMLSHGCASRKAPLECSLREHLEAKLRLPVADLFQTSRGPDQSDLKLANFASPRFHGRSV